MIGFREGLSFEELWRRGRETWMLKADKVLGCELLIIADAGTIRMVGTIAGVSKHGADRLAIEGRRSRITLLPASPTRCTTPLRIR